ncbi:MAG TPA: alpha-L-arabinofuranosidase C-terminal domain-containing protein, partial [Mucilaginibacter sp.]|nr:alpha-L-arabinofuranosidase C-terminal domain-containing protein [Mucilaginibacter sp.]
NAEKPDHWFLIKAGGDSSSMKLDAGHPVNEALPICLHFKVASLGKSVGVANDGFWGIPVKPLTTYSGSFYALKEGTGEKSAFTVSIESSDGKTVYATATVDGIGDKWQKFNYTLTTSATTAPTSATRFVLKPNTAGSFYLTLVSLFPPTYNGRNNGNRKDIMQLLAAMNPSFLRLPGGNYLEGGMFSTRFDWKKTLGPIEKRPGHMGTWGYRSSDGMGLLEYLEWCEDLHMEPVLAVFAGYSLNGDYLEAGPLLKPFVDDALEEIEYVTGDTTTLWGKRRALDGHPQPFKLHYVEVGNEDGFDRSSSYNGRFAQFFDAIKVKFPDLEVISTMGGKDWVGTLYHFKSRTPDVVDEHYYRNAFEMESDADHYDNYDRKGPKVFVGEWATREGSPTPNFNSALGDAAWMTGMERNSDIVVMSCSAPLFVNVNPGGMQWESDLIGYNTLNSYGSPSYYAQQMFNNYKGDEVIGIYAEGIPTQLQKLNHKDSLALVKPKTYPALFYVATRNGKTGTVFLNVVNCLPTIQKVNLKLAGAASVKTGGKVIVMRAESPEDTNTITDPKKIIPVSSAFSGMRKDFNYPFMPYSITILQIETR